MRAKDVDVQVKLVIVPRGSKPFSPAFGKGVVSLCKRVQEMGSLNKAAHDMGMSYSKAWRIMKSAEEEFGIGLLDRMGPKGSTLTPEAEKLVAAYDAASDAALEAARDVLKKELR